MTATSSSDGDTAMAPPAPLSPRPAGDPGNRPLQQIRPLDDPELLARVLDGLCNLGS